MRTLANVPRVMTAVVAAARAVAVEVPEGDAVARAGTWPAGELFLIAPAGEMWSVVTQSPKMPSARAPLISAMLPGCIEKFAKNGGSWM